MIVLRPGKMTEQEIVTALQNKGFTVTVDDANAYGFNAKYHVYNGGTHVHMDAGGNLVAVGPRTMRKPPFYSLHNNAAPTDIAQARKALFG